MSAVLDDESPAHDLGTDIEELCHNPLPIVGNGENTFKGGAEINTV